MLGKGLLRIGRLLPKMAKFIGYYSSLSSNQAKGFKGIHYYPFGLAMAGISSKAAGKIQNKEKTFQGQRFDDDLGLNWVQFKWRNHDPQIGRFIEIDPLSEEYEYNSTYAFSENKVIAHVELEGLESWEATSSLWVATRQAVASNGPQVGKVIQVAAVIATVFTVLYDLAPSQAEINTANAKNAKIEGTPNVNAGNSYTMGTTSDGKSVPNPYGSKGKPDHQEKVKELEKKAQSETKPGETVLKERKIQGQDSNRKPDVQIVDENGKARKVLEAERNPNSQRNQKREAEYKKLGLDQVTEKVGG